MASRVFIFYKLKPGIDQGAFERRAREVEAPLAARSPAITKYVLTRLDGVVGTEDEAPYDYVEALEVTNLEDYESAVGDDDVAAFIKDWEEDVAEYALVHGHVVSQT
jgi:hypothetical protein